MTPRLLDLLCVPLSRQALQLDDEVLDADGRIVTGYLRAPSGVRYPIKTGIPRFRTDATATDSVESFGREWNFFNFTDFKAHWLEHTVSTEHGSFLPLYPHYRKVPT